MSTAEVSSASKPNKLIPEIFRREKRGFSRFAADIVVGLTIPRILPKVNALRTRLMGQTNVLGRSEYLKTVDRLLRETLTDLENQEINEPRKGLSGFLHSQMQNSFIALSTETGYLNIMFDTAGQLPPETGEISEATLREAVSTAGGGDQPTDLINILKRFNVTGRPALAKNTSQLLLSHAIDHFQALTGMQVIRQTATPETTSQGQPLQKAPGRSL